MALASSAARNFIAPILAYGPALAAVEGRLTALGSIRKDPNEGDDRLMASKVLPETSKSFLVLFL
jgi:hypothetical protein